MAQVITFCHLLKDHWEEVHFGGVEMSKAFAQSFKRFPPSVGREQAGRGDVSATAVQIYLSPLHTKANRSARDNWMGQSSFPLSRGQRFRGYTLEKLQEGTSGISRKSL